MKYETVLKDVSKNEIELVTMNDGSVIKCKKVPLATIENMDSFLTGVKEGISLTSGALSFIATCGSSKLYSAVGDASTYMRSSSGHILSASVGSNGKIVGQPGFEEMELGKQGVKAATTVAKVIPWVAIAVTVIEIGTKIVMNQQQIKANQIAEYDKHLEVNEDSMNDLWQVINDYTLSRQDDAHRTADLVIVKTALKNANNSFRKLAKEADNVKKINDHLVCAMKTALDVLSFSYLLNVMYSKVDEYSEYVEKALGDINEKTEIYNRIYDECYKQYSESFKKQNKIFKNTQYDNSDKNKKTILKRGLIDLATLGLAEVGSLGSKGLEKKMQKSNDATIARLDSCKQSGNPFAECIENANDLLLLKKPVLRDEKYLYYQID